MVSIITRISDSQICAETLKELDTALINVLKTLFIRLEIIPLKKTVCPYPFGLCDHRHGKMFRAIFYDIAPESKRKPFSFDFWESYWNIRNGITKGVGPYAACKLVSDFSYKVKTEEEIGREIRTLGSAHTHSVFRNISGLHKNLTEWFTSGELSSIQNTFGGS